MIGNMNRIEELLANGEALQNQKKLGLPPMHLARQKLFTADARDHTCSICLAGTKMGDRCYELICGHIFHKPCLDPWFKSSRQCPNCRRDLTEV